MGIRQILRQDENARSTTRAAMKAARRDRGRGDEQHIHAERGALARTVETIRDIGLDGRLTYSSAAAVAERARRGRGRRRPEVAIRRLVRSHRRGVTVGGFLTGLGGFITLPLLLPTNVLEFYVQATRMVGAIAVVRGYDLDDEEIRTRVLATLVGEDSQDLLKGLGLGPVAGAAARVATQRMQRTPQSDVAAAIASRALSRFGMRSVRLFGKAIPGLGAVIGAFSDRRQLSRILAAALAQFPDRG
ncbi:EcsC family protein [Brachybacterium squillarum]|uniref:EcsC family protein n=1 Tax=Brachybacterium squillarum TaxID=661979 RepID=UPI0022216B8F|nr:EcsC family protein [Brachybacterium squillarum]MCW1804508.1 EcsC family protein [Brachybacterium squillarum]